MNVTLKQARKFVIAVTGKEKLNLLSWINRLNEDATEPVGDHLELEIMGLLETAGKRISNEKIRRWAKAKNANLGLRYALAFFKKYRKKGFGLPDGTCIAFPGTAVDEDGYRVVPFLFWDGFEWYLLWYRFEFDWPRYDRLLRPRASRRKRTLRRAA